MLIRKISNIITLFWGIYFYKILSIIPSHRIRLYYYKKKFGHIGENCSILMHCDIRNPKNIFLGDNVVINSRVLLDGRGGFVKIGNNVDIAQEVNIWTLQHDVNDDFHKSIGADVIIEDFVWIASRVTILPGRRLKRGCVVGSCSLVTKDVESSTIVGGNPAKYLGDRKSNLNYNLYYRPKFK